MKKRTKKLLSFRCAPSAHSTTASKSFLFLFFKKENLLLLPRLHLNLPISMMAATLVISSCAPVACPLAGEQRMQVIDLYFGRDIAGREPVTDAEWADFAAHELTPRFPDGLTVFDAMGQWQNPATSVIVRESSRIVRVVVPPNAEVSVRVEALSAAYRRRFDQVSVGVVSSEACARF